MVFSSKMCCVIQFFPVNDVFCCYKKLCMHTEKDRHISLLSCFEADISVYFIKIPSIFLKQAVSKKITQFYVVTGVTEGMRIKK